MDQVFKFWLYVSSLVVLFLIILTIVCGINYWKCSVLQTQICLATPDNQKLIYPFPCDLNRNRSSN
jgi:hypothetical protein